VGRSNYDHNFKAANQGDMVKHPALMAALNAVLDGWDQTPFRYADTFAGHPVNPLKDQPRYEWQRGVGRLRDRATIGEGVDQDSVTNWIRLYLGKSQLVDTEYPGSARVASDICAKRGVDFRLILWDTNPDVVTEVRGEFASPAHSVHSCLLIRPELKSLLLERSYTHS
jgi:23S rRNA A2030 N6-methylase RlmJ